MKRNIAIAAAALVVVLAACGLYFAPHIREVLSLAQSASLSEEEAASRAEEAARIDQEIRDRYEIPELNVDEELGAAVASGETSLEEAAQRLLEEAGGQLPPLPSQETTGGDNRQGNSLDSASGENGGASTGDTSTSAVSNISGGNSASTGNNASGGNGASTGSNASGGNSASTGNNASGGNSASTGNTPASTGSDNASADPGKTDNAQTSPPQKSEEELRLQNLLAQMYVLRSSFTGQVEGILAACIAEFKALDPSEQTTANKIRIVSAKLGEVTALEQQCDQQVASVVAQIRALDPALADQVQAEYESEKTAKKADVIARYS